MQFYIFAQERYNETCHQFHQSGQGCGNGDTGSSQLRHAEQSEDKCGIQNDIQYKSQHIQRHTDRHTTYASQDGKIYFRDAPALPGSPFHNIGRTREWLPSPVHNIP